MAGDSMTEASVVLPVAREGSKAGAFIKSAARAGLKVGKKMGGKGLNVATAFKEFMIRGNLIDLVTAVVVGSAFTALTNAFVADLITPIIAAIFGKPDFSNLEVHHQPQRVPHRRFLQQAAQLRRRVLHHVLHRPHAPGEGALPRLQGPLRQEEVRRVLRAGARWRAQVQVLRQRLPGQAGVGGERGRGVRRRLKKAGRLPQARGAACAEALAPQGVFSLPSGGGLF